MVGNPKLCDCDFKSVHHFDFFIKDLACWPYSIGYADWLCSRFVDKCYHCHIVCKSLRIAIPRGLASTLAMNHDEISQKITTNYGG